MPNRKKRRSPAPPSPSPDSARAPARGRRTARRGASAGRKPAPAARGTLAPRYRLLFEQNLAGVYCTTIDGRIVDCNESLATMLGYDSRKELLACSALDLYVTPSDREGFLARLQKEGVLTNSELRLRRRDGATVDILENVNLICDRAGRPAIIQGTMVDITERKRAEAALRDSAQRHRALAEELRRLTQHLQSVREAERTRIARELHDELGQALTALNLDLHWLRQRVGHTAAEAPARLRSMCKLLNDTLLAVRRICTDLRPPALEDFGLIAAIEGQAREFQIRAGIRCRLTLPRTPLVLPLAQATAVFRIVQESLTNIARHAQATAAGITLELHAGDLVLNITDDGVGIGRRQSAGARAFGLLGMRERALQWGGSVRITGKKGRGTTVTLVMPIAGAEEEAYG